MNRKHFIISTVVIMAAGLGVFALIKWRGQASEPRDEETTPTLVTVQTGALKLATLRRYVQGYGTVEPAPATAEEPAADAPLAAAVRRCRDPSERHRRPGGEKRRRADGIEFRRDDVRDSRSKNWLGRSNYSRSKTRR